MLTVAVDTGPLYGSVTGVGRSVIEVLAEFEQRPHDIDIVPYALSFRAPLRAGTRRLAYPAALAVRSWGQWNFPRVNRALRPAQLIHGTNFVVPPSRLPQLVTIHDCWALRHPDQCRPAVTRAMTALRQALARGVHVHAPSRATAEGVEELFPGTAVTVVPWATPRDLGSGSRRPRQAHWAANTPVVAAVGTLDHRKNLVRLVAAFAALADEFPDLLLVIAGAPGNATLEVNTAVERLAAPVRSRVVLLGALDHDEVLWLYQNCAVMAYPSLDEGFGFPVLEAMAAGVPVVASSSGSLPEIAQDAALLVGPTDSDALAESLGTALRDHERRRELIAAGRRRLEHYSWRATADGLLALYRSLIDTSPGSAPKSD